ncbi:unnamed protein product [Prorocentrum cordatum]|uniref:Uncharacterized protein n=1 Tax=Prorocentrum cordatum TaxID=2364126 RepID=A0ABN9VAA9_9DINO|nr:unnamed protein product [Polarella glacialis]
MAASSDAVTDQALLAVWTRAWCLHQFAPFANVLLGITGGAIDNWPLQGSMNWLHWHVRFPIVLLACAWPTPHIAVFAHLCNITFFYLALPFVWDHMVWASLSEMLFVVAVFASGCPGFPRYFIDMARAHTIISYFCAGFWKLTTSFLDPKYSCGTLLVAELLSILPGQLFEPGGGVAETLLRWAGWLTVAGEFAIPLSLFFFPRVGVMLALSFHLVILMLPVNAAGGFSLSCATMLVLFVPRGATLAVTLLSGSVAGAAAAAAAVAVVFSALGGTADAHLAGFLALAVLLVLAAALEPRSPNDPERSPSGAMLGRLLAVSLALCHGIVGPVLGVQQMASLTIRVASCFLGAPNRVWECPALGALEPLACADRVAAGPLLGRSPRSALPGRLRWRSGSRGFLGPSA